jgi:GTP cyclohydrolase I
MLLTGERRRRYSIRPISLLCRRPPALIGTPPASPPRTAHHLWHPGANVVYYGMPPDHLETVPRTIDEEHIAAATRQLIAAIGEDPAREGLLDTPARVGRMYAEVFSGLLQNPEDVLRTGFEEGYDEMVVARDISFFSMCEHHFLPFFGKVHIGYVPRGRIVGISKLGRVTDILSRRPQVQERLTMQIADCIVAALDPIGVGVVVEAEHLCMMMRGVRKPGSLIVTSVNRGCFRKDQRSRLEFLELVGHRGRTR